MITTFGITFNYSKLLIELENDKQAFCDKTPLHTLNFSTSQRSEAQEKAKIKTSPALGFPTLEVTLPKLKLKIFRRCQIERIKISVQNYIVSEGS